MMERIIALFVILSLSSCSEKDHRVIKETYADGSKKIVHYFPERTDTTYFKREFYYLNGRLGSTGFIQNNKMNGVWNWWFKNGNKEAHSIYDNGKEKDSILCYYESGQFSRRLFQIDTTENIWISTDYYENGQKKFETHLIGNERIVDNFWREWNEQGELIQEGKMDRARKVGLWKIRSKNDSLITKEMDGTQTIIFED